MKLIGSASRYRKNCGTEPDNVADARKRNADDAKDAQKNDRANDERGDQKYPAGRGQHAREGDIGESDIHQAIEYRLVGDVVGIETDLDQDFSMLAYSRTRPSIAAGSRLPTLMFPRQIELSVSHLAPNVSKGALFESALGGKSLYWARRIAGLVGGSRMGGCPCDIDCFDRERTSPGKSAVVSCHNRHLTIA